MRSRTRVVAGVLLFLFGGALLALALYAVVRSDNKGNGTAAVAAPLRALLAGATPARAPFDGLTQTRLDVGGRCLLVVIADSEFERETGLMDRVDLGPYGGMLFVSPSNTSNAFTMSGTKVPLDIAWYRADGSRGGAAQMVPCRDTVASCPLYRPPIAWRFALETLHGGGVPAGDLGACA